MNTKTLIVSLILGSSSVAMADPGTSFSASAHGGLAPGAYGDGGVTVRDHRDDDDRQYGRDDDRGYSRDDDRRYGRDDDRRYGRDDDRRYGRDDDDRRFARRPFRGPVMLASGLAFGNQGRAFITVGSQAGRFGTLQLNAAGGRTFIKQVYVQFANGQEQVLRDLDRTLVGREGLTLDLGCREAISRIVVYGGAVPSGWRRPQGAFTVTAS